MRYVLTFLLLLFFSSIIEAAYLRSIRVASTFSELSAKQTLSKVESFIQSNTTLSEIQKLENFKLKIIKSDRYYTVIAKPFSDRVRVQKTLDILRTKFKGAYPKKIVSTEEKEIQKDIETPVTIQEPIDAEKIEIVEVEKESIRILEPQEKSAKKEKALLQDIERLKKKNQEQVKKEAARLLEIKKLKLLQQKKTTQLSSVKAEKKVLPFEEEYFWQILVAVMTLLFLIVTLLLISSRRKNEKHLNQEMIQEGIIEQLHHEVKRKEKLISHVSHELRAPITAITGLTHIVLEAELSKVQKDNIKRIESSSQHLLSIINDILDVSKMEAGELKIEKSEFNINNIIDYALNIISIQAKNNNTDMSVNIDADVPSRIVGDSLRLGQILINLLGNAVKFTKDGEITLGVKQLSMFSDSVKLEFSVSDTGIGMTNTQIETVFKSYSQAEGSTSREFGGTGLGLSISKQLVEMMNGEIKVQSKKGIGTIFTFTILFKLRDAENKRYYRLPSASFLNKRILIVDSINKNIIALSKSLGYFNYKTHSIPSFEEAILEDGMKFDLVLLNEKKLTKLAVDKIKIMQSNPNLKLVIVSNIYTNLENKLLEDVRVDSYLRIPFTQQSMLNTLIDLYVSKNVESRTKKVTLKDRLKELSGKKILVAEDNELNHKVISGLLSKSGIELTYVFNGQEAVNMILEDIHFDMILMDINMPIMSGNEASVEIRKYKKYNNIPIIALTADVMDDAIKKALSSGMQGHISKPIIVDIFYQKLLDTMQGSKVEIKEKIDDADVTAQEYEEISISSGFTSCNSDKEFYQSILQDFKKMYVNSSGELEKLCDIGDFKEARRIARDIKDVTLNIGAYNLCEIAANLEYEFEKGGRSNYRSLVQAYSISLEKLFKDIDKYLQE